MDNEPKLRRLGVTYDGEGLSHEQTEKVTLNISQAVNLQDLTDVYRFYTPALMYIDVRLCGRDPYTDFEAEHKLPVGRISIRFDKPIFKGMNLGNDQEWNHVLYGMPVQSWEAFNAFMGQLAFRDRELQLLTRIRTQEIAIADPLYFEKAIVLPDKCPTVNITVYALDSNLGCAFVRVGEHPVLNTPVVVRSKQSYADTVLYANELSADNDPDPYGRIDQARSQAGESVEEIELRERVLLARKEKEDEGNN